MEVIDLLRVIHPGGAGRRKCVRPRTNILRGLITLVLYDLHDGAIHNPVTQEQTKVWVTRMPSGSAENKRRGKRTKAVLPVRIKGKDSAGRSFEELAHTLDVTATGVRLGSVRRELNVLDEVTIFYRQRKLQFRVVWVKKMQGTSEFQAGLQAVTQEREPWGLGFVDQTSQTAQAAQTSGVA